jgi:hypothetical protein
LQDGFAKIQEEKDADPGGYDSAGEDRFDLMTERLTELRRRTYPVVQVLASFLDDDDPTKARVKEKIDAGLRNSPQIPGTEVVATWDSPDL